MVLAAEKQLVDEVFNNAMDVLNEEDRHLPQVENLLPLLRRGKSDVLSIFLLFHCHDLCSVLLVVSKLN